MAHLALHHCVHRLPLLFAWHPHLTASGAEDALAVHISLFGGRGFHEDKAHRRLAGARELHLFAGVDGGEDGGEALCAYWALTFMGLG